MARSSAPLVGLTASLFVVFSCVFLWLSLVLTRGSSSSVQQCTQAEREGTDSRITQVFSTHVESESVQHYIKVRCCYFAVTTCVGISSCYWFAFITCVGVSSCCCFAVTLCVGILRCTAAELLYLSSFNACLPGHLSIVECFKSIVQIVATSFDVKTSWSKSLVKALNLFNFIPRKLFMSGTGADRQPLSKLQRKYLLTVVGLSASLFVVFSCLFLWLSLVLTRG